MEYFDKQKEKKLNILMICPQFYPFLGGYEKAADRVSLKLSEAGNNVLVVTDMNGKNNQNSEILNGYKIIRLKSIHKKGLHQISFSISLFFYLIIRLKKFQIIHVHQHGYAGLIALIVAKIYKKPILLKITSTNNLGLKHWLSNIYFSKIVTYFYKTFDGYIAISKSMIVELIGIGISEKKIFQIPNPIDTTIYKPSSTDQKLEIKKKLNVNFENIILYVGRLDENKNPKMLLEAWVQIANKIDDFHLVIIGEGQQYSELKNKFEKYNVTFLGQVNNPLDWYQISDVFVLTSHIEGFSNSLLEAMSCGLVIISTNVPGSVDAFEKGDVGILINRGNMEELISALILTIKDSKLRQYFGLNARIASQHFYSINIITNCLLALYYQLIELKK